MPEDVPYFIHVEDLARRFAALYGYQEIRTPTFEDTALFTRGAGQSTDVVEKEMYSFRDKWNNDVTLRAEGTAPIIRAYLQHGMHIRPQPVRLFSLINIFRYDRPQAGRYREHHQFDCEAIGEEDPALDAEIITLLWRFYEGLGLRDLSMQLNSIGDPVCRPQYLEALRAHYEPRADELCGDCRRRLAINPLRLLDCKVPTCQPIAAAAPNFLEHLCDGCREHFAQLQSMLAAEGIPTVLNPRLVRGFDYYTRTVFEIWPPEVGAQSAIGGGGRYDGLAEQLGGRHTPAVGFGTGIERLVLNLKSQDVAIPSPARPRVYVSHVGPRAQPSASAFARVLRTRGVSVLRAVGERSLRARLRHADAAGVTWTAIFGDEEVQNGTVSLRDMAAQEPMTLPVAQAIEQLTAAHERTE